MTYSTTEHRAFTKNGSAISRHIHPIFSEAEIERAICVFSKLKILIK